MIAGYNAGASGPRNIPGDREAHPPSGLIVSDHVDLIPEFDRKMSAWIKERKIALRETIVDGLETATDAFIRIFEGANTGKMLVRL